MKYKAGKMGYEVICPLCNTGYLMDDEEITKHGFEKEDDKRELMSFHCDDCDRDIWLRPDYKLVKETRLGNGLFE